jgi:hypothetical protein
MEITGKNGSKKYIQITLFSALEGWEFQRRFVEFAASTDADVRRQYTMDVLKFATVVVGSNEIPLSTSALIDNHLETWQNLKDVFEGVLAANGISPESHANQTHFWEKAGQEMAVAFIAEASKMIGPAMQLAEENAKQG